MKLKPKLKKKKIPPPAPPSLPPEKKKLNKTFLYSLLINSLRRNWMLEQPILFTG